MTDSGTVVVVIFVVGVVIFVVVFVSHDNDGDDDDDKARQAVLLVELPNALLEMYPYPHSARRLRRPECTVIMVVVVLILLRGAEAVVPAMKSRVEEEPSPRREEQQLDVACCGRAVRALLVPATPPLTPWDAIRQSIDRVERLL